MANDAFAQRLFHTQQLFAITLQHLAGGNAGPTFDDLGNLLRANRLFKHHIALMPFGISQLFLQTGDDAIRQLARAAQIALAFGNFKLGAGTLKLFLQAARCLQHIPLCLPLGRHGRRPLLQP